MEIAWCKVYNINSYISYNLGVGLAIGPTCASFFYYIGGYKLPFCFCGLCMLACIPMIYCLHLPDDENSESPKVFSSLFDMVKSF
jgi:MFS family permease